MIEITKCEPGMFCWVELATGDGAAAKPLYVTLQKNGKDVGALYQNKNIPPNWLSYVAVKSVDDAAKRTKDLGHLRRDLLIAMNPRQGV
jgi:predicted enzyme related to lactoylglutathione lyase